MKDSSTASARSRCIGTCVLNATGMCVGCHRKLEEISAWANASPQEREEINRIASQREQQMTQPPT
jgi:predicted Fe-S protein YdhL (DUF1289 family)